MPGGTDTLAVNAAFLQEIKEGADELRELLQCTAVVLCGPSWVRDQRRRLVELLERVRDQLAFHFSLEEIYGYLGSMPGAHNRLTAQATRLRLQHTEFYVQACQLVDEAEQVLHHEAPVERLDSIALQFMTFVDDLHDHETYENEMITQAFADDLQTSVPSLLPDALRGSRRPR